MLRRIWRATLSSKRGLWLLLCLVFAINFVETTWEQWPRDGEVHGQGLGYEIAAAFHGMESNFRFTHHDATNKLAVYGYSVSYFFVFPLIALGLAIALHKRREITPFRVFSLSIAMNYLLSLPFFLLFPVPERWAYPESHAMVLSDIWSSGLIESIRPISGLDNCFPSSHVSLTVIVIAIGFLYRVRFRNFVLPLGLTVIVSTYVLGIHWLPDMVAGVLVAMLSVMIAVRIDDALSETEMKRPSVDAALDGVGKATP